VFVCPQKTINHLPDKTLLHVFSYVRQTDLCRLAHVCKKWKLLAYDGRLWSRVSLRPDYGGLHVSNVDALLALIGARFGPALRYGPVLLDIWLDPQTTAYTSKISKRITMSACSLVARPTTLLGLLEIVSLLFSLVWSVWIKFSSGGEWPSAWLFWKPRWPPKWPPQTYKSVIVFSMYKIIALLVLLLIMF